MREYVSLLSFILATGALPLAAKPAFVYQGYDHKLQSPEISEASGIAVSPTRENFLWLINDSGGTTEIHLSNTDGTSRGAVMIKGVKNKDWEDLAAFSYQGKPYLLIADTGDNNARRDQVRLLIVEEPKLPADGQSVTGEIPIAWEINFSYEGGAKDCEAVAVVPGSEKILLISKRTAVPEVYELPLKPKAKGKQTAKKIGTTKVIAPNLSFIPHRNQPTGLDISRDGKTAAIVTYYGVFIFQREGKETWADAFAKKTVRAGSHRLFQAESVAFSQDGKSILCVSEGTNSPIATFGLQD